MGMRTPIRFETLTGLEPAWKRPMSMGEIIVLLLILVGVVFLIWELRK